MILPSNSAINTYTLFQMGDCINDIRPQHKGKLFLYEYQELCEQDSQNILQELSLKVQLLKCEGLADIEIYKMETQTSRICQNEDAWFTSCARTPSDIKPPCNE